MLLSYPVACICTIPPLRPSLQTIANDRDALRLSDELEKLIDEGTATESDREACYNAVRQWQHETASYTYARAAIVGRLIQVKALTGANLVPEMERYARLSIQLNPAFREGAAKRLLGLLYVLAPPSLLKHGDSEDGLQMLEELVEKHPTNLENRLRLAEAFISLDDPEPAIEHLCVCLAKRKELREDSRRSLKRLVEARGGEAALACDKATGNGDGNSAEKEEEAGQG